MHILKGVVWEDDAFRIFRIALGLTLLGFLLASRRF